RRARPAAVAADRGGDQARLARARPLRRPQDRRRRAGVRDAEVPHDGRGRRGAAGGARGGQRGRGGALQDPRGSSRHACRPPAQAVLDRRDPAGGQRCEGRDEPRRATAAAAARLPAAPGLAPRPLPRAAGNDRALADLGSLGPLVRRSRHARLHVPRQLAYLALRLDHRHEVPGGADETRGVLTVKTPKILAAASAIDLDFRYGCTPAWWQLWKGMYEAGVDLVVTPYRGRPVESPWWRTAPNPTYREGESYQAVRDVLARMKGDRYLRRVESDPDESALDKLTRETISRWVTPRWKRHLERLVEREKPDALIVFTIPMAHLRGIPEALRARYDIPVVF